MQRTSTLHRKRGRPKISHPMHDSGTAELVMKRLSGETAEALDLCLTRELITKDQHWCGVHLRWLYTVRFGTPNRSAIDPSHLGGIDIKVHDPLWDNAREEEYQAALAHLSHSGHTSLVMSICIFNERPVFLRKPISLTTSKNSAAILRQFRGGLNILEKLWC